MALRQCLIEVCQEADWDHGELYSISHSEVFNREFHPGRFAGAVIPGTGGGMGNA